MKTFFKLILLSVGFVFLSCSNDNDSEPYGPEANLSGFTLSTPRDTMRASQFQIYITYNYDNEYALEYGLYPQVLTSIDSLSVTLIDAGGNPSFNNGTNMNPYFVVNDNLRHNELYQTIDTYVSANKIRCLNPYLVFTNQNKLAPKNDPLISDTLDAEFQVKIEMTNNSKREVFIENIKCIITP
ncbi:MAG: hypothetical protein ACK5MG_10565 [Bacteroidales bacterium]